MNIMLKTQQALTCGYEYTSLWYETPCRIKFYDASIREFEYGIALYDFVISNYDGRLIKLDVIAQEAENDGVFWDDAVIELDWNSFTYNK